MASQVEIISKQFVKPSYPTPDSLKHLKLSFLDQFQLAGGIYIPLIFFYQNDPFSSKFDRLQRSQQLQQSLSEALTKFYPFAGRINGNVSIDCNDSGALFVEAQVHADLSDAIHNATTKDLNQYLPVENSLKQWNSDMSNYVLLAVQISFFECGGMAIGICLSHAIADAHSLFAFMNIWAEKCCGTTEFTQPNFDMGFNHFPPIDIPADLFGDPTEQNPSPAPAEEKIVMKRFVFDKNMLSGMKELVSSRSGCHNPTRVEIVSAFIWKNFIDIFRDKADTERPFVAFHAVNLRRRISPALPEFAMGNLAVVTEALSREFEKGRDYFNLVSPLRTAIRNVDSNYIKDEQKRLDYLGLASQYDPEKGYCSFSSWCKFPYYEVDYGWGKPLSVCTTALPFKNAVILMDTRSGDGVQAWITMAEDEMAMLPYEFLSLESNDFRK